MRPPSRPLAAHLTGGATVDRQAIYAGPARGETIVTGEPGADVTGEPGAAVDRLLAEVERIRDLLLMIAETIEEEMSRA